MKRAHELPRVVTPAICAELGITRAQVRTAVGRGHWRRLGPGVVLTRPDRPGRADWAEVGLAVAGPSAAVSGWDAVRQYGIGDRRPARPSVLILTRAGRSTRIGGVLLRRTDRPFPVRRLDGARVVAPARAVDDTALWTPRLGDVRALVAAAVHRGLVCTADLQHELETGPQQGSRFLRTALSEVMAGARSAAEAQAAAQLTRSPVPGFELNVPVVDEAGRVVFVLDVLWRGLRAVLEIDSREHHFAVVDWEATMARHNALTRLGCAVAHYPPSAFSRTGRPWLREVEHWLRRRATELGVVYRAGNGVMPAGPPVVVRRAR